MLKKYLEIGKIVGTHALKGELKVEAWCDTPEFLCQFKTLYFNKGSEKIEIISAKPHKRIVLMQIKGIETVNQGDLLRGKVLFMDRDDICLEEGIYFWQDILGLTVKDIDTGKIYGKITDVFQTGANDVYQITDDKGKEYLIPVIDDVIIETKIKEEYISIRPLKGIFEDED